MTMWVSPAQAGRRRRTDIVEALPMRIDAGAIANDPRVADAFAHGGRAGILTPFTPIFPTLKALNLDLIGFPLPTGANLARLHMPDKYGDILTGRRVMIKDAVGTGRTLTGVQLGRDGISLFASVPARIGDCLVGVGSTRGPSFLADLKRRLGVDIAMHLRQDDGIQTMGATSAEKTVLPTATHRAALTGPTAREAVSLGDHPAAVLAGPLRNYSGQAIGTIEVALDTLTFMAACDRALMVLLAVLGAIAVAAIGLALALSRHLGRPIRALADTMTALAGRAHDRVVPSVGRADEIGAMARSAAVFRDGLVAQRRLESEKAADDLAKLR
ncbi:cache domain-containing protein [uncultured Methylobacterium sp.]|uniref:cache domain-containing protein n=1 Tax=uncultured Methylobacterium sp. TaxID=157278 RepID=UPI0035CA1576